MSYFTSIICVTNVKNVTVTSIICITNVGNHHCMFDNSKPTFGPKMIYFIFVRIKNILKFLQE